MKVKNTATAFAILAAAFYAINIPLSKLLLDHIGTTMMAALLYLGAGLGLMIGSFVKKLSGKTQKAERLTKKELPYTIAMIVLDIIAPILLMLGIARTNSANVSLLNNFEIVATSVIALVIFKEAVSRRLWIAIFLVTVASAILSFEGSGAFVFNQGSLFVLGACVCWGFENNCTKMISNKSSVEIVTIKGCFSGMGSLIIALVLGENIPEFQWIFAALILGFFAYGLSINFYILAQKDLGAVKTSAYYSIAPFLGVAFGMILLGERPSVQFYAAMLIMIVSTIIMIKDSIALQHTHEHEHTHTHEHSHGALVHTHEHVHRHTHLHVHEKDSELHEHIHDDLPEHQHIHGGIIIETERLILREYTLEDFNSLYEIVSDAETMQHYPKPFDEERTKGWIEWNLQNYETYGFGLWAVVLKETGEFIGDCGITIQDIDGEKLPEIGYHIHKKYWRRGFGSEAAKAVRDWAFKNTDYDYLYSYMKYTNVGSYSTAVANGMKKVKEYPDEKNGISYAYAITRKEWEENHKS